MSVTVTPRAIVVLRRALEAGRMDPERVGIRIEVGRGPGVRTGFADEPEPGERTVIVEGITLFVSSDLDDEGATIDVSDEHDTVVVRRDPDKAG